MASPDPHQNLELLKAYGSGKVAGAAADTVAQHLETCGECRNVVAQAAGDDAGTRLQSAAAARDAAAARAPAGPRPDVPSIPPALAKSPDYEVLREISRGGMGVVYLARNRRMDRLEGLKVVSEALLKRAGALERFEREIRSAARLSHPNIVAAYSAPSLEGLLAFAMEYVDGTDLHQLVKRHGPLPVSNACYYVYQAAQGLQHAHDRQMVHRDIKPGNLMLARDGKKQVVKILDFGLAKATSENPIDAGLTGEGQMLGTPRYMAPEQINNAARADIRADIYSLGCTFYHLLAGAAPFNDKESLYEILQAHHTETVHPVNDIRPDVPADLAAIIARMMAKDAEQRYQKPAEVAEALLPFFKNGVKPIPAGNQRFTISASARLSQAGLAAVHPAAATAAPAPPVPPPAQSPPANAPLNNPSNPNPMQTMLEVVCESPTVRRTTSRSSATFILRNKKRILMLGAALAGLCLLAGIVILLKTPEGTLVVEINESGSTVTMFDERETVEMTRGVDGDGTPWVGDDHVEWQILDPVEYRSEGEATISKLPDKSLLVSENARQTDTYVIRAETDLKKVTGLRIEAIQDDSLPRGGPGRSTAFVGSFVLQKVHVEVGPKGESAKMTRLPIRSASAEFSQAGFNVLNLTDHVAGDGWATGDEPGFAASVAVLEFEPEAESARGTSLTVRLVQNFRDASGTCYALGRFRLSVTDGDAPAACQLDADGSQREAAEWVLAHDGNVGITGADGLQRRITEPDQLPADGFRIRQMRWEGELPEFAPADVERLARCTSLKQLAVVNPTDAALQLAGSLPSLESLVLGARRVSDAGLQSLASLRGLRHLRFDGTPGVTDAGLAVLRDLTMLENLVINTRVSDEALRHVAALKRLRYLELQGTNITDAGLEHLQGLSRLEGVGLNFSRVTGTGLKWLRWLPALTELSLHGTPFDDAGCTYVKDLRHLQRFYIGDTRVTDAGLEQICSLSEITTLHLWRLRLADSGLRSIGRLKHLTHLALGGTPVTSADLTHLTGLKKLTWLGLDNTPLDDGSVGSLKQLAGLKSLDIRNTKLSAAAAGELRQALPGCNVQYSTSLAPQVADAGDDEPSAGDVAAPADHEDAPVSKPRDSLEAARARHTAALARADATLTAQFDKEIEGLGKRRMKTEARLHLVDALKAEKEAFGQRKLIPWSQPMRPAVLEYLHDTMAADAAIKKAYDRRIAAAIKAKDDSALASLRRELQGAAPRRHLATWNCQRPNVGPWTARLYSDGQCVNNPGDPRNEISWTLDKSALVVVGRSPSDPKGPVINRCVIEADGATFVGQTNRNTSFSATIDRSGN